MRKTAASTVTDLVTSLQVLSGPMLLEDVSDLSHQGQSNPYGAAVARTGNDPITITSREIAETTGKEHGHVLRDIRAMLKGLYGPDGDGPDLDHPGVTIERDDACLLRSRFVAGDDFVEVGRDEIRRDLPDGTFSKFAARGYVLTQRGYLKLTKPLNDDRAQKLIACRRRKSNLPRP